MDYPDSLYFMFFLYRWVRIMLLCIILLIVSYFVIKKIQKNQSEEERKEALKRIKNNPETPKQGQTPAMPMAQTLQNQLHRREQVRNLQNGLQLKKTDSKTPGNSDK